MWSSERPVGVRLEVLIASPMHRGLLLLALLLSCAAAGADTAGTERYWQGKDSSEREAYIRELMPAGFQVIVSDLEGPVYADESGRTLYKWPLGALRNGSTGDRKDGPSNCGDEPLRVSAGLMSPYPPDLLLPDADTRLSCAEVWPPVLAADNAEAIGKWALTTRANGARQWSYDGFPLYTSMLDREAGDVLGGSKIESVRDGGIVRVPVGPPPDVPPEFKVIQTTTGRLLVNKDEFSVYSWDGDAENQSNCQNACLHDWTPVPAPEIAVNRGEWTVVKQDSGFKQWAYRGRPLYTYNKDPGGRSFVGSDVPDWRSPQWHNVYTQRAPRPPATFTVQDVEFGGQVLADGEGRSVYLYNCKDDSVAQLACDHPGAAQDYRMAICGNGDPERCLATWPYVPAEAGARSGSSLWTAMAIDRNTGRVVSRDREDALLVWAYRQRPVYTFAGDREPGVTNGDGIGEFTGRRNGYKAFVLRDDFGRNAFRR